MPKVKNSEKHAAAAAWYLVVVLSAVGGQGKSLFAELITWILQSAGYQVRVFSADVQRRLIGKLGDTVIAETLATDLIDADDPLALLRAFSPFTQAVTQSAQDGACVLLDTAAMFDLPTIKMMRDLQIDAVASEGNGELLIALVTTSNRDAILNMIASTQTVRAVLPRARIVWVLNERVGAVFPPAFDARLLGLEPQQLAQMRAGVTEIILPRMDDRLWQPVDRAPGLNLVKVVTADPATLAHLWVDGEGKPLDPLSAAVVQRRIAAWIARMMEAASQAVGFSHA